MNSNTIVIESVNIDTGFKLIPIKQFFRMSSLYKKTDAIIQEVNADYYSRALTVTVLGASNQQIFCTEHWPSLTESSKLEGGFECNLQSLKSLVFNSIMAKNG